MFSGIYGIFNATKNKWYIGQSVDTRRRLYQHKHRLDYGDHPCKEMQEDYRSGDRFVFTPIEENVPPNELNQKENEYIIRLSYNGANKGYNQKINTDCEITKEEASPLQRIVSSVAWDGKIRISSVLSTYLGAHDTPYTATVSRLLFYQTIKRIFEPASVVNYTIVLYGKSDEAQYFLADLGSALNHRVWIDRYFLRHQKSFEAVTSNAAVVEYADIDYMSENECTILKEREQSLLLKDKQICTYTLVGTSKQDQFKPLPYVNMNFLPVHTKKYRKIPKETILQMFAEAHATRHKKALISLYDEDPLKNWERDW